MARIGSITVKVNIPKVKKAWAWESSGGGNVFPRYLVFPTLSRRQTKQNPTLKLSAAKIQTCAVFLLS